MDNNAELIIDELISNILCPECGEGFTLGADPDTLPDKDNERPRIEEKRGCRDF
jgi:hypothetical protein